MSDVVTAGSDDTWAGGPQEQRFGLRVRRVLLAAALVAAVAVPLVGERRGDYADLVSDVASGSVGAVVVRGAPPEGGGSVTQQVEWRDGLLRRTTEVLATSGGVDTPAAGRTPEVGQDAGAELQALSPGLRVERAAAVTSSSAVAGFALPPWWGTVLLLLPLGSLVLLAAGPPPERLNRWGWFWVLGSPVGLLGFLLLGGRVLDRPHAPPPSPSCRGGWTGLFLGVLLGAVTVGWGG